MMTYFFSASISQRHFISLKITMSDLFQFDKINKIDFTKTDKIQ